MRFIDLDIAGAYRIEPEPVEDERGYFARWYDAEEFVSRGLEPVDAQGAVSHNINRGTLRGLHFIPEADGEAKLVRCIRGRIFDVIVDLRPRSNTFGKWAGFELSAQSYAALYTPRGCAHGFITLEDNADIAYQFSMPYRPGIETGVRWDDPDIGIDWPADPAVMSDRDKQLLTLRELQLS
jgi:dTDP-4-dehydrorhamnose 3,5-epimerase